MATTLLTDPSLSSSRSQMFTEGSSTGVFEANVGHRAEEMATYTARVERQGSILFRRNRMAQSPAPCDDTGDHMTSAHGEVKG